MEIRALIEATAYPSARKSERSQDGVRKTTSKPIRKLVQDRSSSRASPKSEIWVDTAAVSTGASNGRGNTSNNPTRSRACAEIDEKTVPVVTSPTVPRTKTNANRPRIPTSETL